MNDHHSAFYLSLCLAIIDAVKNSETGKTNKSYGRIKRLKRIEGEIVKATDNYLPPNGFDKEDMDKASLLFDEIDARMKELYPAEEVPADAP